RLSPPTTIPTRRRSHCAEPHTGVLASSRTRNVWRSTTASGRLPQAQLVLFCTSLPALPRDPRGRAGDGCRRSFGGTGRRGGRAVLCTVEEQSQDKCAVSPQSTPRVHSVFSAVSTVNGFSRALLKFRRVGR